MKQPNPVAETPPGRRPCQRSAFTLIELLVVIAVIAVLASLLLPVLAQSKAQAQGMFCQNNTRQLMLGCQMYCDDNASFFPYNMGGPAVNTNINWAEGLLDWETTPDNTNTAYLTCAALGAYVAKAYAIFRCPSDTVLSSIQRTAGWQNRARSYSMNASVGNAGVISQGGFNVNNPDYIQFFKSSSLPTAAQIFVFIEEHPDTIYDGYFVNNADSNEWTRLPASYHNGGANVSFADGHAELHHWLDAGTKLPAQPDVAAAVINTTLPANQKDDFNWVVAHMSVYQETSSNW